MKPKEKYFCKYIHQNAFNDVVGKAGGWPIDKWYELMKVMEDKLETEPDKYCIHEDTFMLREDVKDESEKK